MVITSFPCTTSSCIGGTVLLIHHAIGVLVGVVAMGGAKAKAGPRGREPASTGGGGGGGMGVVGGGRTLLTAAKLG